LLEEASEKAARVRQADAEITQALKAVEVAKSRGDEAKAGVAKAVALHERWELENSRVAALVKRGVADDQTRDETRSQYKAAIAALDEAEARYAAVDSLVAKARADVVAARARKDVAIAEEKRV